MAECTVNVVAPLGLQFRCLVGQEAHIVGEIARYSKIGEDWDELRKGVV